MFLNCKSGTRYHLEEAPFALGGEGKVFDILGHPNKVAKIYHAGKVNGELEEKLTYM